MGTDRLVLRPLVRRWSVAEIVFLVVAGFALTLRAVEMTPSPLNLARLMLSLVSVGFVIAVPYKTIVRRALLAFVLESVVGGIAFALVDVPLVMDHRAQIGMTAIAIDASVRRFARDDVGGRVLSAP